MNFYLNLHQFMNKINSINHPTTLTANAVGYYLSNPVIVDTRQTREEHAKYLQSLNKKRW